jgi:hypothetical protein
VVKLDIVIEEVVEARIIQSSSKQAVRRTRSSSKQAVAFIPLPVLSKIIDDRNCDGGWSTDESVDGLTSSGVNRMLAASVKPSTASKYGRIWDKWVAFSTFHKVEVMPPDVRALEIFLVNSAELSGSAGVALTVAAAVAHFCALKGFALVGFPRIGKILRGGAPDVRQGSKAKGAFYPRPHRGVHEPGQEGDLEGV